ncbi:MAG TPA: hypothetical protein VFX70_14710 [Mycobacteriales bacterium]|nr:hypothetical protein [Mycobacteriales bacterium]
MSLAAPTLAALRRTVQVVDGLAGMDRSWREFVRDTRPGVDLGRPEHRASLLRWLNRWGCRIRLPRPGEPAVFDHGVEAWWERRGAALPTASLPMLDDAAIAVLCAAYVDLVAVPVTAGARVRTMGPTAAAKTLYAIRPDTVMLWDEAIAIRLHGSRDGAAFAAHLRLGRAWAAAVAAEAGVAADALPALLGRPVSLAKILDEYCYVTITRGR